MTKLYCNRDWLHEHYVKREESMYAIAQGAGLIASPHKESGRIVNAQSNQ